MRSTRRTRTIAIACTCLAGPACVRQSKLDYATLHQAAALADSLSRDNLLTVTRSLPALNGPHRHEPFPKHQGNWLDYVVPIPQARDVGWDLPRFSLYLPPGSDRFWIWKHGGITAESVWYGPLYMTDEDHLRRREDSELYSGPPRCPP
jgi:hypothetical protein